MKRAPFFLSDNVSSLAHHPAQNDLCQDDVIKITALNLEDGQSGREKRSFPLLDSLKDDRSWESMMKLNTTQLRKLGDKLEIKFKNSIKKGALRSQIITHLGLVNKPNSFRLVRKADEPQVWSPPKIKTYSMKEGNLRNYHSTDQVCAEKRVTNELVIIEKENGDSNEANPKDVKFKGFCHFFQDQHQEWV